MNLLQVYFIKYFKRLRDSEENNMKVILRVNMILVNIQKESDAKPCF